MIIVVNVMFVHAGGQVRVPSMQHGVMQGLPLPRLPPYPANPPTLDGVHPIQA